MDIRRVGNTGIHTVEGNVAGGRAASLTKQAALQREEYELTKSRIQSSSSSIQRIHEKFTIGSDNIDQEFRDRTIGGFDRRAASMAAQWSWWPCFVGLVTATTFREVRNNLSTIQAKEQKQKEEDEKILEEVREQRRQEKRKKMMAKLSFADDDEEEEDEDKAVNEESSSKKKVMKNPEVDTSFLPDRDRDRLLEEERRRQEEQWQAEQEAIKREVSCPSRDYYLYA